jgi:imidazole glycerol phosphate synthase subunit HisF
LTFIKTILISGLVLFIVQCNRADEGPYPEFEVVSYQKEYKDYGAPYLIIKIRNTGTAPGFNVSCEAVAKTDVRIIDSALAYFKNGDKIYPGEVSTDEAVFLNITSHDQYRVMSFKLKWQSLD